MAAIFMATYTTPWDTIRGWHRAAFMYSMTGTVKLNRIDPQAWLADIMTRTFRRPQRLVAGSRTCGVGLPRVGVLAGRDDGDSTAIGGGIMAFSSVVGAVCGDTGDVLIGGNLGQQFGQHGRVADIAAGDLDRPDLQCFLVDPEMDLAPRLRSE